MRIIMYFFLIGGGVIAPVFMFYLWCRDQHLKELLAAFITRLREHLRLERPALAFKMAVCDVCDERVYAYGQELQQIRREISSYDANDQICAYMVARLRYADVQKRLYEAEVTRDKVLKDLQ